MKVAKKILDILGRILLGLLGIILLLWLLIQTSPVQNFIVGKLTKNLSKELKTEVQIGHVNLSLFDKVNLEDVLIKDLKKDTLLSAGAIKVRLTDWFFLRDKIVLKYIGLENAVIQLHRRDSIWNYQFIADYLTAPPHTALKKQSSITLSLEKIDFKNVNFIQNDEWIGQKMQIKTGSLLVDADTVDFDKSIFKINSIDLDKPLFALYDFDGFRPDSLRKVYLDTGMYYNQGNILVQVKNIKLTNGSFVSERQDPEPVNTYFDGLHIHVNKIAGIVDNLLFKKDTITANVNIAAIERSGFELKKLKTNFRLTPQIMEFKQLDLRTPESRIGDYYAMKFDDFKKDMNGYIDSVIMDARFRNSVISTDDIAFFAPALANWKRRGDISGHFYGKVSNFSIPNLFIRSSTDMYAAGSLTMKGLPDIDHTVIHFTDGKVQMSYSDLAAIVPPVKSITIPNLAALGQIHFGGNFDGTIYDFNTIGNFSTSLGGLYANLKMQFPSSNEPKYSGNLITQQFNLGKFLNIGSIGQVSFNGKVAGSSFDVSRIRTNLNGTFSQFEFNNYNYSNIVFNGTIQKQLFTGDFKASDPNFDFTSNIAIDLTHPKPHFNILGDLVKSDLKALNFTNKNFQLTGLFDLNFEGRNIDEFQGNAKILNAILQHDSTRLSFDSLTVSSYTDSAKHKALFVQSNEFDVMVSGQYNILDLPNSFQAFLSHYYPSYISAPKSTPKDQDFFVTVNTREFSNYAQVIDTRLSGLNNVQFTGSINTRDSGKLLFTAFIPDFKYTNFSVSNAALHGTGDFNTVSFSGNVDTVRISDSTYFPHSKLNISSQKDHSVVNVTTSANNTLNEARLNADIYTLPDGVRIDFQPSSFVINEKKWDLEKEGEIIIRKQYASAQNVKFVQGFQEITVETDKDAVGEEGNNLVVKMKDVSIGDFTPIFTTEPRMEGVANGTIHLHDFYSNFNAEANIRADQFRLQDDSVGVVNMAAQYFSNSGKISFDAKSDNETYNFAINGAYDLKDSSDNALNSVMHLNRTRIGIVNMFLGSLFSNITGYASGDLTVKGKGTSVDLLGTIAVEDAGITVDYTKVRYHIDSALFKFKEGVIDFGQFRVKDEYNNTGTVKGKLYEHAFSNMQFDFDMQTDKLLLLNTTAKDNDQFYGKAIGKATLSLKGPEENMKMSITGAVNDTTHIFIPTDNSSKATSADFIVFKQHGTEISSTPDATSNLSIDLDLTANNQAEIDVILDALTGDIIKATGNGRLQIKVPANGDMTMKGRYNIENGRYDFNFQSFLHKPFNLIGDSYIEWNGDPYNANIHIDAQYVAEHVSINDLISNQNSGQSGFFNSSIRGYRGDVYVIAELRGRLSQPDINFRLDFPLGSVIKNDNDFALFLNRMQSDKAEMLKQVTYLIVFGAFAPYGEARTSTTAYYSLGLNTISQKLTAEINKIVSNLLYKVTGDRSWQLDISANTYSSSSYGFNNNSTLDRQSFNFKINKSLLNGNVVLSFGSDFDFGLTSNTYVQGGSFQWLPDISAQFILTKDRKLRAIIFNRSSLDATQTGILGRRNRQGVSLSYTFNPRKEVNLDKDSRKDSTGKISPK
jgi:hypothetical protein